MRLQTARRFLTSIEVAKSTLCKYGDDIWERPQAGCSRFAFQNARGIDRGLKPADDVLEAHQNYGLSIFGIAEPNCGFDDKTVSLINAALKKDHGCGHATCGPMATHPGFNPGGIMQAVTGSLIGRQVPAGSGCDKMGRYTWTKFRGKG